MKIDEKCASQGIVSCINTINYNMIHIAYPQKGNNKKVQIDLLLTKHPDFAKFFMYSPTPQDSRYKGAHRNQLLHAISTIISYEPIDKDENGEDVTWRQNDVTDEGYFSTVKTLIDDEGHRLKYKHTNEDLEHEYALNKEKNEITHNVEDVIEVLFGKGYTINDIDTFEKCFNIVKNDQNFKYKDLSNDILHQCAISLYEKRKRLEFPTELKPYLKY